MSESLTTVTEFRLKLFVSDFAKRRRFYEETIRWPILEEWDRGVMYDTGAAVVELLEQLNAEVHNTSCDVSLRVFDVESLWNDLKDRTEVVFALRQNPWGDTSFCIADPGGFRLTFFTPTNGHPRPEPPS